VNDPGPLRRWVLAARPRTLPAAIVPVVVGAAAVRPLELCWGRSVECALVALLLQVATNFANDYSDGVRGTDEQRVGPFRLTASGLVPAKRVRTVALLTFALAAVVGLALSFQTSWWLVPIGASAVLAGWFYTGGPRPYGYMGLGELFVFLYFGLVATMGTAYVQDLSVPHRARLLAFAVGAAACLMLEANNLRDIDGDRQSGKRTLAARLGRRRAIGLVVLFVLVVGVAAGLGTSWWVGIVAVVIYVPALRLAFSQRTGRELLPMLMASARAQLALGVLLVVYCVTVN
jgi:1,4-dihydroxy-2-naphthoate octaprenyltransferase